MAEATSHQSDQEYEVELSCNSSSISEIDETESPSGSREVFGIQPYYFEPVARDNNRDHGADLDTDTADFDRLQHTEWCRCSQCCVMSQQVECLCCKEIPQVTAKIEGRDMLSCITDHPGFEAVCTNMFVLETAYYTYRQQYGQMRNKSLNEKYRYTGYRQFVRWCFLGKDIRVTLPSCVVSKIRAAFPSGDYTGFEYPKLD